MQLRHALPVSVLLAFLAGGSLVVGQRLDGGVRLNGVTQGWVFADGSSAAPSMAFASEPGLGWYRRANGRMTLAQGGTVVADFGSGAAGLNILSTGSFSWGSGGADTAPDTLVSRGAAGRINLTNTSAAIGSSLKIDALPTVSSGFGTSPSITAGSTPLAGSVNVGTGGVATSGVINFNGTAFPSAPFCVANDTLTTLAQRASATTTQLTITSAAWTASDVVSWVCISSK